MMLTKTNYMNGIQCPRFLWIKVHKPETLPKTTEAQQHRFDQGHLVEEYAHGWFPKGKLVQGEFTENIRNTELRLKEKNPIFEAGISTNHLYSRADILEPVKGKWNIIEVKSGTSVKDEHILDLAFQKYVYEKKGLKINKCFVMVLNNQYVKKGKIDPKKLMVKTDVTERVNNETENVEPNVKKIFKILELKEPPELTMEDIEKSFWSNPVIEEFYENLPEGSVFELTRGGKKCCELFGKQICTMVEIPDEYQLTGNQKIQKECAKTNKVHIEKEKIREFLNSIKYPAYYMDFETFGPAIPIFDGTKPYQQIPFQFSVHVVDKNTRHISFLAEGKEDPRKKFISELKKAVGEEGSIIVYNKSFEISKLRELAQIFPKEKKWVEKTCKRIVDLIVPFSKFHYYNPKQKGRASLKEVLPAVTGKSYENLSISGGEMASLMFMNITFGDVSEEEAKKVRKDLEVYCGLDTEGMVWIVDELKKLVK